MSAGAGGARAIAFACDPLDRALRNGDDGVASALPGGPLLGHERASRPLGRPDDRYRVKGGAGTSAAAS